MHRYDENTIFAVFLIVFCAQKCKNMLKTRFSSLADRFQCTEVPGYVDVLIHLVFLIVFSAQSCATLSGLGSLSVSDDCFQYTESSDMKKSSFFQSC